MLMKVLSCCTNSSLATKLLRLVADKKKVDGGDGGIIVMF